MNVIAVGGLFGGGGEVAVCSLCKRKTEKNLKSDLT